MRRLYGFTNRNPALPVLADDDDVTIIRKTTNTIPNNTSKTIVRRTTNNVVENYNTDINYTETDNVYLNETGRCPYIRFPWWVWLLLALGLLSLLGLALGLGLGLGLQKSSVNSRCSGNTCPANSQCINNRCECNSGYFYDYSQSLCSAYRHVGMTCTTTNTNVQCITNAYCASNGYCICNTGYFLDQNNGVCTAQLARYTPCANDDQCIPPFVCAVSLCDCNQTSYYSSGQCIPLGYPPDPCSLNSQCVKSANCSTTTCQCPSDHYFATPAYQCIRDQFIGGSCTQNYQCITNAYCSSASPFSSQCECNSGLYYNTFTATCDTQLNNGTSCAYTGQCVNNLLCIDNPAIAGVNFQCLCLTTQYLLPSNQTCISYGTYNDACSTSGRPCDIRYGLTCSTSSATCVCSSLDYWNGSLCVTLLYPGEACSSPSQCINSSSCVSSICQCNTNYYYSTLSGKCLPQQVYGTSCTLGNYQCLNNTQCYDLTTSSPGACSCNPTYYYYDGTKCATYATYSQSCNASVYGPICNTVASALVCSGSICTCLSTSYYNGSSCVSLIAAGFPCTSSSQCVSNTNCSSGFCTCLSGYYFSTTTGTCTALLTYLQNCTSSVQCPTNMICNSSQCICTPSTYYVNPNCVSRVSQGGTCSGSILCDTTLGLVCTANICSCNSTQYWSTLSNGTQICANLRTLGQSCTLYSDCQNSATSVTCVSNLCECLSSGYYLDQSAISCLPLKVLGMPCTYPYNFQCASFNCNSSNICGSTIASTITSNVTQASQASFRQSYSIMCISISFIRLLFI